MFDESPFFSGVIRSEIELHRLNWAVFRDFLSFQAVSSQKHCLSDLNSMIYDLRDLELMSYGSPHLESMSCDLSDLKSIFYGSPGPESMIQI